MRSAVQADRSDVKFARSRNIYSRRTRVISYNLHLKKPAGQGSGAAAWRAKRRDDPARLLRDFPIANRVVPARCGGPPAPVAPAWKVGRRRTPESGRAGAVRQGCGMKPPAGLCRIGGRTALARAAHATSGGSKRPLVADGLRGSKNRAILQFIYFMPTQLHSRFTC